MAHPVYIYIYIFPQRRKTGDLRVGILSALWFVMVGVWPMAKTATESKSRTIPLRKGHLHRFWGPVCRKLAPEENHEKVKEREKYRQ